VPDGRSSGRDGGAFFKPHSYQNRSSPFTLAASARYYFSDVKETKEFVARRQCLLGIGSIPYNTDYVYSILWITQ